MSEPDKRHYRVTAHRLDDEHPGANVVYTYAYASSVIEAATLTLKAHERPRGLYGVGLYRIVRVEEYDYGAAQPVHPQPEQETPPCPSE